MALEMRSAEISHRDTEAQRKIFEIQNLRLHNFYFLCVAVSLWLVVK